MFSFSSKAYLEINRNSADSMVKFYSCFPMSLDGHQLCIDMAPQYKTVKDEVSRETGNVGSINTGETKAMGNWWLAGGGQGSSVYSSGLTVPFVVLLQEAIFTALIKDSDPKVSCWLFLHRLPTSLT